MPAIGRVGSLDYGRGVPWDFMHLLFENVVQNLVKLWMGKFKGLNDGSGDFTIPKAIWKKIGDETVAAMKQIPAAFVRLLGNLAEDQTTYNAEGWGFWFMYIGPALLKGRLSDKYYKHYILLVDIMKTCIQFTISQDQLKTLGADIVTWVTGYERYVCIQVSGSIMNSYFIGYTTSTMSNASRLAPLPSMAYFTSQITSNFVVPFGRRGHSGWNGIVVTSNLVLFLAHTHGQT